jgi:hypothetical protein
MENRWAGASERAQRCDFERIKQAGPTVKADVSLRAGLALRRAWPMNI